MPIGKELLRKIAQAPSPELFDAAERLAAHPLGPLDPELHAALVRCLRAPAETSPAAAGTLRGLLAHSGLRLPPEARKALLAALVARSELLPGQAELLGLLLIDGIDVGSPAGPALVLRSLRRAYRLARDPELVLTAFSCLAFSQAQLTALFALLASPPPRTGSPLRPPFVLPEEALEKLVWILVARMDSADALLAHLPGAPDAIVRPVASLARPYRFALEPFLGARPLPVPVFAYGFRRQPDQAALAMQLFARLKTGRALHEPGSTAAAALLQAALEALAEGDPLGYPLGLLARLHEWAATQQPSLLPAIYRMAPHLFTGDCTPDPIRIPYALAQAGAGTAAARPASTAIPGDAELLCQQSTLWLRAGHHDADLVYAALPHARLPRPDALLRLFAACVDAAPDAERRCHLARLALVPRPRNDALFLRMLQCLLDAFARHGPPDRVFVLEAAQGLLHPYLGQAAHQRAVVAALRSLGALGNPAFRRDLAASLIRQSVDDTLPPPYRATYIRALAAVPAPDPGPVVGILVSLARDARAPAAQHVALDALSQLVLDRPTDLAGLAPQLADCLWAALNSPAPAARPCERLCLALVEALGTDLAQPACPPAATARRALEHLLAAAPAAAASEPLLAAATRFLLLTRAFRPRTLLLARLPAGLAACPAAAAECLKWLVEFTGPAGTAALLPALWAAYLAADGRLQAALADLLAAADLAPLPALLRPLGPAAPPPALRALVRLLPRLLRGCPPPALPDVLAEAFRLALALLAAPEARPHGDRLGVLGVDLLRTLLASLAAVPDPAQPAAPVLAALQPQIITGLGLACNHDHPLVRAHGLALLCELFARDFDGLPMAEHPRLERILVSLPRPAPHADTGTDAAADADAEEHPPLVRALAAAVRSACWRHVLAAPRLLARFPGLDRAQLAADARAIAHASLRHLRRHGTLPADYAVDRGQLVLGPPLAAQCALSLLLLDAERHRADPAVLALALAAPSPVGLEIVRLCGPALVPDEDLRPYLHAVPGPSAALVDVARCVAQPWALHMLAAKAPPEDAPALDEPTRLALLPFLAEQQADALLLAHLAALRTLEAAHLLQALKATLPALAPALYLRLFQLLLNWPQQPSILQAMAFMVAFPPDAVAVPAPLLATLLDVLRAAADPAARDCVILLVCRARDAPIRHAAATLLDAAQLSPAKRSLVLNALR